jgi:hypothetical protein
MGTSGRLCLARFLIRREEKGFLIIKIDKASKLLGTLRMHNVLKRLQERGAPMA